MKNVLLGLSSVIWAIEIFICIAALVFGLIFNAFRPYTEIIAEPDVETYVPNVSEIVDGVNFNDGSDAGVYISSSANIPR